MKKKLCPKTRPTGFVPANAERVPVPETNEVDVQSIKAWRVKTIYMQERGRWETLKVGKLVTYVPPRSYDGRGAVYIDGIESAETTVVKAKTSVWQRIVDWCEARKINPEEYVRQCFKLLKLERLRAPEPAQLLGDVYFAKWNELQGKRDAEVALELSIEKDIASRHYSVRKMVYEDSEEFAQIYVIADGAALGLSPLFRYCLASAGGTRNVSRLARRLLPEAVMQFESSRRFYRRHWKAVLPPGFSKQSKALYPILLAKFWAERKS